MRHKNEVRRFVRRSEPAEEVEKPFARHRIKTGTRFIENQNLIPGHQSPTDQNALSFSLREECPRPIAEIGALHLAQALARLTEQLAFCWVPEVYLRIATAGDNVQSCLPVLDPMTDPGADETDFFSKLTPVRLAVLPS